MKISSISKALILLLGILFVSCSEDDSAPNDEDNIVGTWELIEFNVSDDATNELLPNAEIILTELISNGCKVLVYTFEANGELTVENKILFIGTDIENISCPTNLNSFEGSWELQGSELTIVDGDDSSEETITIQLSDDIMVIAGSELNSENLTGSEFVLRRQ